MRIAIIGSGFAGSILARILQLQGHRVLLLERSRHPRFALGESSTPLAAICLERLAGRYGLEDLYALAAWGRWTQRLPHLRRGLKRGFTFYGHQPGLPFTNGPTNERRLLVAASPSDDVADAHWLRSDVDHHLVLQAAEKGVEILEEAELEGLEASPGGWRVSGRHQRRTLRFKSDLLIDASGSGGFLARQLRIGSVPTALRTSLVFGHFDGTGDFMEIAAAGGAAFSAGPYRDEKAAIHHVLQEGWMYVLPFDHGTVSAGFVVSDAGARKELTSLSPDRAWAQLLNRYPTLRDQFGPARPAHPVGKIACLQHRFARAAGERWVLLPHACCFLSPLFSTGIAWSLLAVERLGLLFEPDGAAAIPRGIDRYGDLLLQEADQLQRLLAGAYAAMRDFDLFVAYSFLYFAAASFAEASQRLLPEPAEGWAWQGFLGSTDVTMNAVMDGTLAALHRIPANRITAASRRRFEEEVRRAIAPRNLAGLAESKRNRLYPLDLERLMESAGLLGLTVEQIRHQLPRLRG
jgi:FADH2 O2-dependent halogenase